jgi:hypothetical protein
MQYNKFWVGWDFGVGIIFLVLNQTVLGLLMIAVGFGTAWLEAKKEQKGG